MKYLTLIVIVSVLMGCSGNDNKDTKPDNDVTNSKADTSSITSPSIAVQEESQNEDTPTSDDLKMETTVDYANAERIDFEKEGSSNLVWEQKVGANKSKTFVFKAKIGQKLELGFIDDTNIGSMDLGKYSIEPNAGENFTMQIEETKDYTFTVTNNSKKSTSFRIFIAVE